MAGRIAWSSEGRKRTGNSSRCSARGTDSHLWTELIAELTWVDHVDPEHPKVVELDEYLAGLGRIARSQVIAALNGLFTRAAQGELWEARDRSMEIEPIMEDPDLYELRYTALKVRLRFYHGEPEAQPFELWRLHRHIKTTTREQQIEIEYAADRYRAILGTASQGRNS